MSSQKSAAGGGKGKKGKGKTNNNRDEEETEEKLQAVILADDFDTRFGPFTEEKPRVGVVYSFYCAVDADL